VLVDERSRAIPGDDTARRFPRSNLNYPLNTYDISTATIDSYLSTYLPSQFSPNYTRNKANTVFAN